jgi:uncharacterized Fe-S radical SAM superfamily protein PflX
MMLHLQEQGCHNINLVTLEHAVPQILEALLLAVDGGLHLPLVYNTSAYDSLDSLCLMDGIVDIYMLISSSGTRRVRAAMPKPRVIRKRHTVRSDRCTATLGRWSQMSTELQYEASFCATWSCL